MYVYKPQSFHNYIFTKLSLLAKFVKVSYPENFQLYGNCYMSVLNFCFHVV